MYLFKRPIHRDWIGVSSKVRHLGKSTVAHSISKPQSHIFTLIDELICNKHISLKKGLKECSTICEQNETTIIEELIKKDSDESFNKISRLFRTKKDMRAFLFSEMIFLYEQKAFDSISFFCQKLGDTSSNKKMYLEQVSKDRYSFVNKKISNELANNIIELAYKSGDYISALSFMLKFHNDRIEVSGINIRNMVKCLCVNNSFLHNYNSYMILRLVDEFPQFISQGSQALEILEFLMKGDNPFFANIYLQKLSIDLLHKDICISKFVDSCVALINQNIKHGNTTRAIDIWLEICGLECSTDIKHHKILAGLISAASEQGLKCKLDQVVESIPDELKFSSSLAHSISNYYGTQNETYFSNLIQNLRPPIHRDLLSLLFSMFMHKKNMGDAQKVLKSISNSREGISGQDFEIMIRELLSRQDIEACLNILSNRNIQVTKSAYLNILKHCIEFSSFQKKAEVSLLILRKFSNLDTQDECKGKIAVILVEYILKHVGTRGARSFYIKLSNAFDQALNNKRALSKVIKLEKWKIPSIILDICNFDSGTRTHCLYMILRQSLKVSDLNSIIWSTDELRFQGISFRDIIASISISDKELVEKFVKPVHLQDCI